MCKVLAQMKNVQYFLFTPFQNLHLLCSNIFPVYCFNCSRPSPGFLHSTVCFQSYLYGFFVRHKILCYLHVCSQSKIIYEDIPLPSLLRLCAMSKLFRGWFTIRNCNVETYFPFYYRFITKEFQVF